MNDVILVVEDNPDDYEAMLRSFHVNRLSNPVEWSQSAERAWEYLLHSIHHASAHTGIDDAVRTDVLPIFILLDLNMPGKGGRALLKDIKQHPALKHIPVIVLTTSNDPNDVMECYNLGASTYIQKPVDFDSLTLAIRTMKEYWFNIAILPRGKEVPQGKKGEACG